MIYIDFRLFELVNQFAGRFDVLDRLVLLFTNYGPFAFGFVFVFLWFTNKGDKLKNRELVLFALTIVMITLVVNKVIEISYFRERPFVAHSVNLLLNKSIDDPSFPSNHSAGSFALALALFWKHKKTGLIFLILAFCMALSRMYVGVHYPLDITVGALIALSVTLIMILQQNVFQKPFHYIIRKTSSRL